MIFGDRMFHWRDTASMSGRGDAQNSVNRLMAGNIGYSISKWLVSQRKRKRHDM